MHFLRRYLPLLTIAVAVAAFYLYDLSGVGVLGPDEPRYTAIGRGMAQSGDWVTPILWGSPWFEKPPLVYWLTAMATSLGAPAEISGRLPVVLISLLFLYLFFWLLSREFGDAAATFATLTLATSAGWIAYSTLCLTDLPLACFFSLAILLVLPFLRPKPSPSGMLMFAAGVCLGLAVLAKAFVPLVLSLPAVWFLRAYWRQWWLALVGCVAVAAPWYVVMLRWHGRTFIQDFFLKQQVERLYSPALQHIQPFYFYVPVLIGLMFPWSPFLVRFAFRGEFDRRHWFLISVVVFGLVFFSVSLNKLPGYLLPLLPALFALLGSAFEGYVPALLKKQWLLPSACLASLIPLVAQALPSMLSAGRIGLVHLGTVSPTSWFYVVAPIAVVLLARRSWAPMLLALTVIAGGFYVKIVAFPVLDEKVSARVFWKRDIRPIAANVCEEWIRRDWVYGLSFYWGHLIPPCYVHNTEWHLLPRPSNLPVIKKEHENPVEKPLGQTAAPVAN